MEVNLYAKAAACRWNAHYLRNVGPVTDGYILGHDHVVE
jgi:hypothetical protein